MASRNRHSLLVIRLSTTPIATSPHDALFQLPDLTVIGINRGQHGTRGFINCPPRGAVNANPARPRLHSLNPRRVSKLAICVLIVERDRFSSDCACENPPHSTIVQKTRSSLMSKSAIEGLGITSQSIKVNSYMSTFNKYFTCVNLCPNKCEGDSECSQKTRRFSPFQD